MGAFLTEQGVNSQGEAWLFGSHRLNRVLQVIWSPGTAPGIDVHHSPFSVIQGCRLHGEPCAQEMSHVDIEVTCCRLQHSTQAADASEAGVVPYTPSSAHKREC